MRPATNIWLVGINTILTPILGKQVNIHPLGECIHPLGNAFYFPRDEYTLPRDEYSPVFPGIGVNIVFLYRVSRENYKLLSSSCGGALDSTLFIFSSLYGRGLNLDFATSHVHIGHVHAE